MRAWARRRGLLALPLAAAGCGGRPAEPPLAAVAYGYLTPLSLQVGGIRIDPATPRPPPGDIGATLAPPAPAEAVRIMARDRLFAVGAEGEARFRVVQASLLRAGGGLTCMLACRLEIAAGEEGARGGFVEATARAAVTGAEAGRAQAAERLLRRTMDGLNVEFEFQIRQRLRDWLLQAAPGGAPLPAPAPGEVAREELPRT
jgi:hypothetical protein